MIPTGPHDIELEIGGPYKRTGNKPMAYWYREKGYVQFCLYAEGVDGEMFYCAKIPTRAPKPEGKPRA